MKEITLEILRTYLKGNSTEYLGCDYTDTIKVPFQITSKQFLRYAEYDLNNEYEHHLVNALSNTKRALDCQIDTILYRFCLYDRAKKENWSFPKKVDIMKELGIVSPRILKRINKQRNLLEHEYKEPSKEKVEDALDVASLFEAYTEKFIHNPIEGIGVTDDTYGDIDVRLNFAQGALVITPTVDGKLGGDQAKTVSSIEKEYLEYLKIFVELYKYT